VDHMEEPVYTIDSGSHRIIMTWARLKVKSGRCTEGTDIVLDE